MRSKAAIALTKSNTESTNWAPLEKGTVQVDGVDDAVRLTIADGGGQVYVDRKLQPGRSARIEVRGAAGTHILRVLDAEDCELARTTFALRPQTRIETAAGPYGALTEQLYRLMAPAAGRSIVFEDKFYKLLVTWSRDHVYTLKALKYYIDDVKSGMEFYTDRPRKDGSFWDCVHPNQNTPMPSWFCEALGDGYFTYDRDMKFTLRRIPIEADVEFVIVEGVWYAWKASGDDAWMAKQLPHLDRALEQNTTSPEHWSQKHGLRRRSFCMDSWDFANPHYCEGDHRCFTENDPQFLFHGDNSGLYSIYWRLAEMHEALGDADRAKQLRKDGQALRKRANKALFFNNIYGHMIPEDLPPKEVYALVGDERKRMSLSTGYSINRGMPTHAMAVKILKEYQRRGKALRKESFAEWWTMDPPYTEEQWPQHGPPIGDYMNGGICAIVAGELAKAAFDHGMEEYGADILRRVWENAQRDGGNLHQVYRRIPLDHTEPEAEFQTVDLRPFANVGLKDRAHKGVTAWMGEGGNDMRNLPVGRRSFGAIEFDVVDPTENDGRAIVRLDSSGRNGLAEVTVPVGGRLGRSVYFMHTLGSSMARHTPAATYDVIYTDGTEHRIFIRNNHEIAHWWGISDGSDIRRGQHPVDRATTRAAWRGANAQWKTVGLHMYGWDNPHPEKPIAAIRCTAVSATSAGGRNEVRTDHRASNVMLGAISLSDQPVSFEPRIRSYGLPDCWSQAAVYYSIAEGLAGIEDTGRAFSTVKISPRWAATESARNQVTLHYPASDGYCSYDYKLDRKRRRITLNVTGSFERAEVHCLLPGRAGAKAVSVGGEPTPFKSTKIEKSVYVDFTLDGLPTGRIVIDY
jgi:hypothetical protein